MKKRALANFKHLLSRGSLAHLWLSGKQVAATVHSPLAKRSSSTECEANKKLWRRGRDSNPRYPFRYGRFRGGSFQPLTHLSAPKSSRICPLGRVVLHFSSRRAPGCSLPESSSKRRLKIP